MPDERAGELKLEAQHEVRQLAGSKKGLYLPAECLSVVTTVPASNVNIHPPTWLHPMPVLLLPCTQNDDPVWLQLRDACDRSPKLAPHRLQQKKAENALLQEMQAAGDEENELLRERIAGLQDEYQAQVDHRMAAMQRRHEAELEQQQHQHHAEVEQLQQQVAELQLHLAAQQVAPKSS